MKINIVVEEYSIGFDTLDWFYAYRQNKNKNNNYESDITIVFNENVQDECFNVLYCNQQIKNLSTINLFDIVLIDNDGESIQNCTPEIKSALENYSHVYFLCGSFVTDDHYLKNKIIPYNHCLHLFRRCYTDGFYPQYYDTQINNVDKTKNFFFINGQNLSYRHYFAEILKQQCDFVNHFRESTEIRKTLDCQFESSEDQIFRDFVNEKYANVVVKSIFNYYTNSINCGINNKFGNIPMGYFLLPEYSEYKCAIFPESCWTNDQFFMTEKVFKCFVTECLPMPIAGANIANLYNKFGFYTAFDLCPPELRKFDSCKNHIERYQGVLDCIKWLNSNADIMISDQAKKITKHNKQNFYSTRLNMQSSLLYERIFKLC